MAPRADKRFRITRRKEISRLFRRGQRATDALITLYVLPNDEQTARCRLGVAVSSRHGKAAHRNRLKRLCREAFRLIRQELPAGSDFMIVPRVGGEFTLAALQESIRSVSRRLCRERTGKDAST